MLNKALNKAGQDWLLNVILKIDYFNAKQYSPLNLQSKLAHELLKQPYNFDFGLHDDAHEREIEHASIGTYHQVSL